MFSLNPLRVGSSTLAKAAALCAALFVTQAQALPSFARQTGMDCAGCHVGGFGPQLTPAGIKFKLGGYTDSDGKAGAVPLSGMIVASRSHTSTDQDPPPDHLKANNNMLLDEASIFLAGKLTEHMGAFVQVTHDGVAHTNGLDQTDVRYARTVELGGKETLFGLSVNNNPGVQDPFNTMPVWSFPFASSPAGYGAADTGSLINGGLGLEHRVVGASAYAFFDQSLYAELGSYRSMSPSLQRRLGQGEDQQRLGGNAYWRLAWFQDKKSQAYHIGLFGWDASLEPNRTVSAPRDKYRDVGIDGTYQFLGTRQHIATVNGSYVMEKKTEGLTTDVTRLKEARLNTSYYFDQTWGATAGVFSTHGSDASTDARGSLIQLDWTPWGKENATAPNPISWANVRLGAQYWMYNKFAGDTASAKDHNTLYLFAWTSF
jgi:hypothetical protein